MWKNEYTDLHAPITPAASTFPYITIHVHILMYYYNDNIKHSSPFVEILFYFVSLPSAFDVKLDHKFTKLHWASQQSWEWKKTETDTIIHIYSYMRIYISLHAMTGVQAQAISAIYCRVIVLASVIFQ